MGLAACGACGAPKPPPVRLEPLNGSNVGPAPPEPLRGVGVSERALVDVQPEADLAPPVRMNWVLIRDAAAAPAAKPAE